MYDMKMEVGFEVWVHLDGKRLSSIRSDGEGAWHSQMCGGGQGHITCRSKGVHPNWSREQEGSEG